MRIPKPLPPLPSRDRKTPESGAEPTNEQSRCSQKSVQESGVQWAFPLSEWEVRGERKKGGHYLLVFVLFRSCLYITSFTNVGFGKSLMIFICT